MADIILYGFGIKGKSLLEYTDEVASMSGIVGATNMGNDDWALLFERMNDAKVARNILDFAGADVWKECKEAVIDEKLYRSFRK